jgi:segregation and condensation protein A
MQEQIMDLLLKQEDVTWKTILYDLVKTEQMNPWDVNVTLLTQKYIEAIKEMKEHDFRISGKILLAAAFLLKMKSAHLLDHDIINLDKLMNQTEEEIDEEFFDDLDSGRMGNKERQQFTLIPRNPQPRSRKVSIHDLVSALHNAMASKKRILARQRPVKFERPNKSMDIMEAIRDIYHKITYYSKKEESNSVTFSKLLPPNAGKMAKVFTFLPLLHLEHEKKVETMQEKAFDEIHIKLLKARRSA